MASKLDGQAMLLLVIHWLFGIASALSGTFIPVYLWKASQSFMLIGWYTFGQYIASITIFWLAGKWVKSKGKMYCLRLGILLSGIFYLTVLLLGEQAKGYGIGLGVINGMALGFYWLAYNVVYFEVTEPDTRDRFNGWMGLLGSLSGMIAPWISGIIIIAFKDEKGYSIIFTISLAIFIISVVLSFWLKRRESVGVFKWNYGFKQLAEKGNHWRFMFAANVTQGVREGVFLFLVGLTVYLATQNESKLGTYTLVTSLVALISFWLTGKRLSDRNRKVAMLIGACMLGAVILPLFWSMSYTSLLIFGIGTSLFMPLYTIPMTSKVFDLIGQSEGNAKYREELIILRETGLVLGRVIGLSAYLIVLSWSQTTTTITWLLFAVGITPIASWWFMRPFLLKKPTVHTD